jgi:hypothetical protein
MAEQALTCWSCGAGLAGVPLPIGRREECPQCAASLHACRQCIHFDPKANKSCREPVADEVVEKEAGNFCDYFQPRAGLSKGGDPEAADARARLARTFGGGGAGAPGGAAGGTGGHKGSVGGADEAKRKLDELFGKKK